MELDGSPRASGADGGTAASGVEAPAAADASGGVGGPDAAGAIARRSAASPVGIAQPGRLPEVPPAAEVRRLFESAREEVDGSVAGTPGPVTVIAVVDGADGQVREVQVRSPLPDTDALCVEIKVERLVFPPFERPTFDAQYVYDLRVPPAGR